MFSLHYVDHTILAVTTIEFVVALTVDFVILVLGH